MENFIEKMEIIFELAFYGIFAVIFAVMAVLSFSLAILLLIASPWIISGMVEAHIAGV